MSIYHSYTLVIPYYYGIWTPSVIIGLKKYILDKDMGVHILYYDVKGDVIVSIKNNQLKPKKIDTRCHLKDMNNSYVNKLNI